MEDLKITRPDAALTFELSNEKFNPTGSLKSNVAGVSGAFTIKNIFSASECHQLVDHVFSGIQDDAQPVLWRKWAESPEEEAKKLGIRIIQKSETFAEALFNRIKQHLPETIQHSNEIWHLAGLSERIRFIRYDSGQNFPPHTDGPYVKSNTLESQLTCLVYLDKGGGILSLGADFRGGELFFLTQERKGDPNSLKKVAKVAPEPGLCVVFPHRTLHEGNTLLSGHKYVIRTDVMYSISQRNNNTNDETHLFAEEKDQH